MFSTPGDGEVQKPSDNKKLRGLNPLANYADQATAVCRQS
jgi:hypothetical protein